MFLNSDALVLFLICVELSILAIPVIWKVQVLIKFGFRFTITSEVYANHLSKANIFL